MSPATGHTSASALLGASVLPTTAPVAYTMAEFAPASACATASLSTSAPPERSAGTRPTGAVASACDIEISHFVKGGPCPCGPDSYENTYCPYFDSLPNDVEFPPKWTPPMAWQTIEAPPGVSPPHPITVRAQSIPPRHYFPEHSHRWNQLAYAISGVLTVTVGRALICDLVGAGRLVADRPSAPSRITA